MRSVLAAPRLSPCSRFPPPPRRTPLDYAAPDRLDLARRPADLRRAHRPRPTGSVVVRVSGDDEVDDNGLLTGPEGTWLDETATPALEDLQVWSVPHASVLRQRPGHYYWQAYLTGAARGRRGADRARAGADRHAAGGRPRPRHAVSALRHAGARRSFYLSSGELPGERSSGTRFQTLAKTTASRWGLKAKRWTSVKAGVQDGFNVAGFSTSRAGAARSACRPTSCARQRHRARPRAPRGRELGRRPGLSGARRGRPRERPASRARPHGGQQEARPRAARTRRWARRSAPASGGAGRATSGSATAPRRSAASR